MSTPPATTRCSVEARPRQTATTIQFLKRTASGGSVVTAPLSSVTNISAGRRDTCTIRVPGIVQCWGDNDFGQLGLGSTTPQTRPVTVPSFALNIDPRVTVRSWGRVARVTVLANCEARQQLHMSLLLRQGDGALGPE